MSEYKVPLAAFVTKEFIADLRGGFPTLCSFCEEPTPPEELEPEEAGQWVCHACLKRWDAHDHAEAQRAKERRR